MPACTERRTDLTEEVARCATLQGLQLETRIFVTTPICMTFFSIDKLANLHDGYQKAVSIKGRELLLVQEGGMHYILENICPHAGYPMTNGKIIEGQIRCPMHGYLFALDSGTCTYYTEGPCRGLHTYQPTIRDDQIGLLL